MSSLQPSGLLPVSVATMTAVEAIFKQQRQMLQVYFWALRMPDQMAFSRQRTLQELSSKAIVSELA